MAVTDVDIKKQQPYAGGLSFGNTGPYERLDGVLTITADPDNPANASIVDLKLAPRDPDGTVSFRADFTLLAPRQPARGKRRLLVDVVNRGRRRAVVTFNRAPAPGDESAEIPEGDGFLFYHGYSVVSIGWQWDVYRSAALLGLEAPYAAVGGKPVRGQAVVEIRPDKLERTRLLANRVHRPYPAADLNDPDAVLLVRDWEDGPDRVVPRGQWRFACETASGVVPSREHVYLESGFEAGKIYNLVYTTEGAPVVGTGLLAVRDVAVWLRHPSALNPVEGGFERVYGYGVSQTGRLLRHFMYLGLNVDEKGRTVYDGLLPHVAGGRRGEFNHRFAQPSQQSSPGFGHLSPFADNPATDPFTGKTGGLLDRLRESRAVPKIIYTNSSAEYWRGDGSLTHIDPSGRYDLEPAREARIYHLAGTQHGAGSVHEGSRTGPDGSKARYPLNVVDYRPLLRAALINLDRWVSEGIEPPPSRYPRLADGSAVSRSDVLKSLQAMPGLVKPDTERLWVLREVDLGAEADKGIGHYSVREGGSYACFVSAVDGDGNEIAGIRLPDLEVPVATHAGWNLRDPETGAPEQMVPMVGWSIFFAPTRAARLRSGDPRLSLEERYESRDAYLEKVRLVTKQLAEEGYILKEDTENVVLACAKRYDAAMAQTSMAAQPARGTP